MGHLPPVYLVAHCGCFWRNLRDLILVAPFALFFLVTASLALFFFFFFLVLASLALFALFLVLVTAGLALTFCTLPLCILAGVTL
jgi:hypothetical protein